MVKNIIGAMTRSCIVSFIMLLLCALVLYLGDISNNVVGVMVVLTYFVSTLIGGIYCGKHADKSKYLWGIISGVGYFLLLVALALIGDTGGFVIDVSVIVAAVVSVLGGMIGGMIS